MSIQTETGVQLLRRLETQKSLRSLEPLFFPNGLACASAVEVYGKAGVGKSEVLLHLMVNCITPTSWQDHHIGGLEVGAIYMDNDCHFSLLRLISLLEIRLKVSLTSENVYPTEDEVHEFISDCLGRLYVVHCYSSSEMITTLHSIEQFVANKSGFLLLLVDSVSAFYWEDRLTHGTLGQVDSYYQQVAIILQKLMSEYTMTVILSRQHLITYSNGGSSEHRQASTSSEHYLQEEKNYLGRTMEQVPSWRICLRRTVGDASVIAAHIQTRAYSAVLHFNIMERGLGIRSEPL